MSYPPEVKQYFDQQKREQQLFVNTARIKKTLKDTTVIALGAMDKLIQRGAQLEMNEERAEELKQSSRLFLIQAQPWWKAAFLCSCLPSWWFSFAGK